MWEPRGFASGRARGREWRNGKWIVAERVRNFLAVKANQERRIKFIKALKLREGDDES